MANTYLYGAYGHLGETVAQNAVQAGTVAVYAGTAPVNLVRGYAAAGVVNNPVKVTNFTDAQRKLGYSPDWKGFTLCEAFSAHFNNQLGNIGPIYVINVLDPDVHAKAQPTALDLIFANGRAEFASDTVILDTFELAELAEGADYTLGYNFAKGTVIVESADGAAPLTGTLAASFHEVDTSAVTAADIIGAATQDGKYSGLAALRLLYQDQNAVPNIVAAPGWSGIPSVYNALISNCRQINGHWEAFAMADIPLEDAAAAPIDTIAKAKAWRAANAYISRFCKVYWPMARDNAGGVYHLSTLGVVEMMRADFSHNSVPMETPGNKQVAITAQFFGEGSANRGFDQQTANELTSSGISTAVFWGGRWVLWGDHTAGYTYGGDYDATAIFDVNVRMPFYILNSFQREWGVTIDEPMTKALAETILNREQSKLDALASMGALIGEPKIEFLESENTVADLMNGDFRWDVRATPTPPFKSGTVYVSYTDEGFRSYFGEGE
jgi:phage tail sheath protein FI